MLKCAVHSAEKVIALPTFLFNIHKEVKINKEREEKRGGENTHNILVNHVNVKKFR